jgi:AAA domain/Protein of unknown function (DUF4011)
LALGGVSNVNIKILKTYLKRLTNLTHRNKSLWLPQASSEQFIDVHAFDFLNNQPAFSIIKSLLEKHKRIVLCDVLDSRFEKVNLLSRLLRRMARRVAFIQEETGSQDLYVGYPMVQGKFADGTMMRSALLFFPVELQPIKEQWSLLLRDEPILINRSFLLGYSHFNENSLSDEWLEPNFEDFPSDALAFRTALYEWIRDSHNGGCPLQLNFNKDIFADTLEPFHKVSKADLNLSEKQGELRLMSQAVLGIFPQAGSYLVADYEEMIERQQGTKVQRHKDDKAARQQGSKAGNERIGRQDEDEIEHGSNGLFDIFENLLPTSEAIKISESSLLCPFSIDASQERAIQYIKKGRSMVVQGPPGTGKSQLIANLIADYTAQGKKVLVVSQKRAALDTVYKRLQTIDLQPYVALVHDFRYDRKALYSQLATQIDQLDTYKQQNLSLDSIFLERNFWKVCRTIEQHTQTLDALKTALFDESVCGISVKELYLSTNIQTFPENFILNSDWYKTFKLTDLSDFQQRFKRYAQYQTILNQSAFCFWQGRKSFTHWGIKELGRVEKILQEIPLWRKQFITTLFKDFSLQVQDNQAIETSLSDNLKNIVGLLENKTIASIFYQITDINTAQQQINWLKKKHHSIIQLQKKGLLFGDTLHSHLSPIYRDLINKAIESRDGWWSWLMFGDKEDIKLLAQKYSLSTEKKDLQILYQYVENREKFDNIINEINQISPYSLWESGDLGLGYIWAYEQALTCYGLMPKSLLLLKPSVATLHQLIALLEQNTSHYQQWLNYLTPQQIEYLYQYPHESDTIATNLRHQFDNIVETDNLKNSFSNVEWQLVEETNNDWETAEQYICLAWLQHIESLYPILRGVSSLKISQIETELQEAIQQKQAISQAIVLMRLREQTYRHLDYNRLHKPITYRNLQHQVNKKRNIWAIRRLLAECANEVFKLIPCWMASPETVSAVFPLATFFDLVIFDEASQCFTEQGLPAILRAKQVVISGDSQQLQPSDIYRVRFETDTEDLPELETDSLLDLACQYFPQTRLLGHYRSQSLALIQFSNEHFYQNTLQLLPHIKHINDPTPSIVYLKVEGLWKNQTNVIECEQVCGLVAKLLQQYPNKSIGIVTFNQPQQALIEDSLFDQKQRVSWIKNIENVQGDECDILIFSVGYAPDDKGNMSMQFGLLNQQGGENRLNVAITRAKEKIFIITSLFPQQLHTAHTTHQGPKLLQQYLSYALSVSDGTYQPRPTAPLAHHKAWYLKEKLLLQNPTLSTQLPFVDLVEKAKEQYQTLILTDDDLYHQSLSAKDAHAYLPLHLIQKGWQYKRLWSREYWQKGQIL